MEKCGFTGALTRVRRVTGVSRRPRGQGAPPLAGVICCAYVLCVARRHSLKASATTSAARDASVKLPMSYPI
jgi:hypothetical protein